MMFWDITNFIVSHKHTGKGILENVVLSLNQVEVAWSLTEKERMVAQLDILTYGHKELSVVHKLV